MGRFARVGVLVVLLLGVVAYMGAGNAPARAQKGDNVHVVVASGGTVPVASTLDVEKAFSDALQVKDEFAYKKLFADGKMFRVESGVGALVIDRTQNMAHIRILDGEHIGKSGWVPIEFAKK